MKFMRKEKDMGVCIHSAKITLSKGRADFIEELLKLTGNEIYDKHGLKGDETITETALFDDGCEADIKLVICDDDEPYTEGILFNNAGSQLACTDAGDDFIGRWEFEHNCENIKNKYIVDVEVV